MWLIKAFLRVSHGQNIQASKVKHGLPFLKVSGFVSWGKLGNVHFRSFWFQQEKYGEGWVKCVRSDTDSETWQLWPAFGKGKSFFPPLSLRVEQRFTVSPWLPQLGSITANVKNEKMGKKGRIGWGKKAGWCHPFFSNKDDLISSKNIQTLRLFPSEMPKWQHRNNNKDGSGKRETKPMWSQHWQPKKKCISAAKS